MTHSDTLKSFATDQHVLQLILCPKHHAGSLAQTINIDGCCFTEVCHLQGDIPTMIDIHLLLAVDPVPLTTQYVLVSNLCPECLAGSLDQEINGDGRWTIEWYPVQCAVGTTPLVYSFQGSNAYYIKMQISNHRWAAGETAASR